MPKVSVIIPVYGVEQYIERCARSLFEQTLDDIEYLFIDDCTPDNSIEVLKKVLKDYPERESQVVIHRMNQNSGQAAVRKWGMLHCTGEYVIHCDTDDWVDTNMYCALYEKAEAEKADIVVCDYVVSSSERDDIVQPTLVQSIPSIISATLTLKVSGALWNKLVRRSFYLPFLVYPTGNMGEDQAICIQLYLHAETIAFVSKAYYWYFSNEGSITKAMTPELVLRRYNQSIVNADVVIDALKSCGLLSTFKKEMQVYLFYKKNILTPLIKEREYYKLWKNTFPKINYSIISNGKLPLTARLMFVLRLIRVIKK